MESILSRNVASMSVSEFLHGNTDLFTSFYCNIELMKRRSGLAWTAVCPFMSWRPCCYWTFAFLPFLMIST